MDDETTDEQYAYDGAERSFYENEPEYEALAEDEDLEREEEAEAARKALGTRVFVDANAERFELRMLDGMLAIVAPGQARAYRYWLICGASPLALATREAEAYLAQRCRMTERGGAVKRRAKAPVVEPGPLEPVAFGLLMHLAARGPCVLGPVRLPAADAAMDDLVRAGLVRRRALGGETNFAITAAGRRALAS